MGKELKVIGFAAIVCLVCSLLLATVYSLLRDAQDENKELDMKKKVLAAFGVQVTDKSGKTLLSPDEVKAIFEKQIEEHVLNSQGELVEGMTIANLEPEDINDRDKATGLKKYYPYYVYTDPETGEELYGIHVSGMGLWSVVKAYLALKGDFSTIAGAAFYDHAETPGLGGEIDKPWFQNQFKGKKLVEDGEVRYFEVVKPSKEVDNNSVHGPTGATMTSKGITDFINRDFAVYYKHFRGA